MKRALVTATILGLATSALVAAAPAQAAPGDLVFVEQQRDGVGPVAGLNGALDVAVSADGRNVYAVGTISDAVVTFTRDPATNKLTFLEADVDGLAGVDGLDGAHGVAVAADGESVYVTGNGDDAVAAFVRNQTTGALGFHSVYKDGVGGVDGLNGAWAVAVAPDGKQVFVTGDEDSAMAVFTRDPVSSALSLDGVFKDGAGGVDGLMNSTGVAVSPDGTSVYASGWGDDSVVQFQRIPSSGTVVFATSYKDGVGGVDGLDGARGVAVAANGTSLSVVGENESAIATFSRNPGTGTLSFLSAVKDAPATDGLGGARDVAYAPNGTSVYVASNVDSAIVTLGRNTSTGVLTWQSQTKDAVSGVDGLATAVGVAVSPDGRGVYSAAETDDAVAAFNREQPPVPAPPAAAKRSLVLKAAKKVVDKGRKVKLTGTLTSTAASCAAGQDVALQRATKGKPYRQVGLLRTTSAGAFTTKVKVRKKSTFRVVVVATAACGAAESPAVKVRVRKPR